MSVTAIDSKSALIIIDLQKGIVTFPTIHPIADIICRARALTNAFRLH